MGTTIIGRTAEKEILHKAFGQVLVKGKPTKFGVVMPLKMFV